MSELSEIIWFKELRRTAWETALKDLEQRIRVETELIRLQDRIGAEFDEDLKIEDSIIDGVKDVKVKAEKLEKFDLTVSEAFNDLERLIAVMKYVRGFIINFEETTECIKEAIDAIIEQSLGRSGN